MKADNLLAPLPQPVSDEVTQELLRGGSFRLERIVSIGHTTPADEWYDQESDEWVLLLSGAARLQFENEHLLDMRPGDAILIPAHQRHRVDWTDPQQQTVWLALHVGCD